jgi:hypothetical protein
LLNQYKNQLARPNKMKNTSINNIKNLEKFVLLELPIQFLGYKAIGYFPYETAQLKYEECVTVARNVFSDIETILQRRRCMDNKVVFVFQDTTHFGTTDFAIQFKDAYCKMGSLNQIEGYAGRELKTKPINPVNSQGLRYVNAEIGHVDQDEEYI